MLVVGGGNTGYQIGEELVALAGGPPADRRPPDAAAAAHPRPGPVPLPGGHGPDAQDRGLAARAAPEGQGDAHRLQPARRAQARHPAAAARDRGAGRSVTFADGSDSRVDAVVWATGFRLDHSFVQLPVFDDDGRLGHRRGVTDVPGLYFLGLPWQHTRGSALLGWVKDDAQFIAQRIAERAARSSAAAMSARRRARSDGSPPVDRLDTPIAWERPTGREARIRSGRSAGRSDRRRAHRPRVPVAHGAAAAGRASHRGRPARDGAAHALGTPQRRRSRGLVPPDSSLARDAEEAAQDLLTPVLLNHSRRAYAWGAAIAALQGSRSTVSCSTWRRCSTTPGSRARCREVDFTVRSAALAREFADRHGVPADGRELVANAIAMHHTPGVGLESGAEAFLLSAGAGVDVFGLRSDEIPDAVRRSVVQEYPRLGFKREFAGGCRAEAKQVPRGRAWYLHRFAVSDLTIRLAPFRELT